MLMSVALCQSSKSYGEQFLPAAAHLLPHASFPQLPCQASARLISEWCGCQFSYAAYMNRALFV